MKEKRYQGFTLIELLAVIVILAVIALIATPLIMNVINDAKKSAARDAGYSVIKAGELKAATSGIENTKPPYHYDENSNLPMKGTKPTKFTLDINEEMDTQLRAWINGFCVVKNYDNETVTIDESKKSESDCVNGGSSTIKKYDNGTAIYFNPETNQKCSASEAVSTPGTKTGCMKWYAFNDSEESSTVNVILDHNTTATIAWNSSRDNSEMREVKTALESDTSTWNKSLKPRLIEANEIAKITGNTEFDATIPGKDDFFYFDTNTGSFDPDRGEGTSKYAWLFDYTNECKDYGCSIADSSTRGYWTSSPIVINTHNVWYVSFRGDLFNYDVSFSDNGVRPVITISKSVLS